MPVTDQSPLAQLFQALGNDVRLRLLALLGPNEVCVCHLVEALGLPQPLVSQHLATLRTAGIVTARREGKWMHYRIVEPQTPAARAILDEAMRALRTSGVCKSDSVSCCGL